MSHNRLSLETSPYLLQHKDNPVHWMGWSEQALQEARDRDQPILLSVGYAACHWCHVMAHESFEDPVTAGLMNQNFINIKVDREERPDIDRIYMAALHSLGEQGGWPLTMFLTPDALPFWGGTYFPPENKYGRPSFRHVLTEISRIWQQERNKVTQNAEAISAALQHPRYVASPDRLSTSEIYQAADVIINATDPQYGGLKGAPKFPQGPIFTFLWEVYLRSQNEKARDAVLTTLTQISNGGIYDHLAGGIARYSTDHKWLAPHFEKMLYDNAQYVSLLTRAWLKTESLLYATRIEHTVEFVLREMTSESGCFTSSYDADSEGEEGKYYVWSLAEIEKLLTPGEFEIFQVAYDVTPSGNWEGRTILNRTHDQTPDTPENEKVLASARAKLRTARSKRIPPQHDDKVLADWNGLFITALAEASLVFGKKAWADSATQAFSEALNLFWKDNRLLHSHRAGSTSHEGTDDDYANLIAAALALHALTGDAAYITKAQELTGALEDNHWDAAEGGLYHASQKHTTLPIKSRTIEDDATPNANSVMIKNYNTLYHLTGNEKFKTKAEKISDVFTSAAKSNPFAAPGLLKNALSLQDTIQLVLTNDASPARNEMLLLALKHTGLDATIHVTGANSSLPANHPAYGKTANRSKPTLYVCRGATCANPATNEAETLSALRLLGIANQA
ncbi:MAG: thioredoxin domain-containing protein [Aestuariivirga sp.]|nr:thioredoxin domain-containing protein [Aestuariivirga sp.]